MALGFLIMVGGIWNYGLWIVGFFVIWIGPILQEVRFRRLKRLREDPLRCECGGHFVPPWDLGFDVPTDHLICDNDKGLGPLGACTNFIITPLDYHGSTPTTREPNEGAPNREAGEVS